MNNRRSTLTIPLVIIAVGIVFQLQAAGLLGEPANAFLAKTWPLIILAAGLDLFFSSKRIIGAVVLTVLAVFVLILNFSGNARIWSVFTTFWPLLLIVYGLDMLFSGRSLAGGIALAVIVAVILFVFLSGNGISSLPNIQIPSQISNFLLSQGSGSGATANPAGGTKAIDYPISGHALANFQLEIPSGKLQLKSAQLDTKILSGTVKLAQGETLDEQVDTGGSVASYRLSAKQNPQLTASEALWNLQINQQPQINWSSTMINGYQMIDLRGINLASVNITNQNGNIDVMLPYVGTTTVQIATQKGEVRIFVPDSVAAFITVTNPAVGVTFPETYTQSGAQIYPASLVEGQNQVMVNVSVAEGQIKIVTTRN